MRKSKQFILNTVILTASTLLMQWIAVLFNAYLSKQIGSSGIGLYQLILSVYGLSVTFASSGIRLATTRLVVEAQHSTVKKNVRTVMRNCLCYSAVFGLLAGTALFFGAESICQWWLHDMRPVLSLKILALSLPFLAMSAALCGYFTAQRKVSRYACTQIGEQLLRITITVLILTALLPATITTACAAVAIGACVAEFSSCFVLFFIYRSDCKSSTGTQHKSVFRRLLSIAIPDAISSYVRSALITIQHLLIPLGLQKAGATKTGALAAYGLVHGMALPIILFPSAFLNALASLLIPEIAEYKEQQDYSRINSVVTRVIKYTFLFSIGVAGILWTFSHELSQVIYQNHEVGQFIRMLAPLIPIMYADTAVDGILKGMGQQMSSMRFNIIDATLSVILVWLLLPKFAIQGYLITIVVTECLNFALSIHKLTTITSFRLSLPNAIIKPILCCGASLACAQLCLRYCFFQCSDGISLTIGIALTIFYYFILLRLFSCLTKREIHWFWGNLSKSYH